MAVALGHAAGDPGALVFGERKALFDLRKLKAAADGDESYDVAPSGNRIICIQRGAGGATEVRIVLN